MSILFEPVKIKNMALPNRFVRSATYDGCAQSNGQVSDKQMKLYTDLAAGGVGLIVTGITFVHSSGQILPFQNSIAGENFIPGLKKLTAAVHHRGAKIAVQLFHAGRERARFIKDGNEQALAPSFIHDDPYFPEKYRSMTEDEIWNIIQTFGDAAQRAREAEFDAVQVHGAHAFLFSQFLSPFTNHRDDQWGGTLENRLRFHREVYRDIKAKVGDDYPILIKLGVQDGFAGGLELSEGKVAARLLDQCGFDSLEISQGLRGKPYAETEFRTKINRPDQEAYFRHWCKEIKNEVRAPVMMVGGLRTFGLMEEIVQNREADFISLCRPFIREPGIINDWISGSHQRAKCISCNKCLAAIRKGEALHCVQQRVEENRQKVRS